MDRIRRIALILIFLSAFAASLRSTREEIPAWKNAGDRQPANYNPDESWRTGVKLPTLLTEKFVTYPQVCEEARRQNKIDAQAGKPERKFALVLAKMHLCDYMMKSCIHAARTFFDPCNHFVLDNFVTFHARTYFDGGVQPPGGKQMVELYESPSGPRLVAIDLETCTPLKYQVNEGGHADIETGITANSDRRVGETYAWKSEDRLIRFAEMRARIRELLTGTPGAFEKIDAHEWEKEPVEISCAGNQNVPVLSDPIFVPEIRLLMNEQYFEVTGKNAKASVRWPLYSNASH